MAEGVHLESHTTEIWDKKLEAQKTDQKELDKQLLVAVLIQCLINGVEMKEDKKLIIEHKDRASKSNCNHVGCHNGKAVVLFQIMTAGLQAGGAHAANQNSQDPRSAALWFKNAANTASTVTQWPSQYYEQRKTEHGYATQINLKMVDTTQGDIQQKKQTDQQYKNMAQETLRQIHELAQMLLRV